MNNTRALKYLSLGLCLGLQYIRLRCLLFWEYLEYLLFWNTFIWQCNKIFYLRFLYRYFKPVAILPSSTFYNLMEQAYSSIRSLYNYIPEFLEFSNSQLKHGLIFCCVRAISCIFAILPWQSLSPVPLDKFWLVAVRVTSVFTRLRKRHHTQNWSSQNGNIQNSSF